MLVDAAVRERIPPFVVRARACRTDGEALALCEAELDYLYSDAMIKVSSVRTYLSHYKRALRAVGIEIPFTYRPTTNPDKPLSGYLAERDQPRQQNKKAGRDRVEHVQTHACEWFDDLGLLAQADHMLTADNPYVVCAGLLAVLGRREYEIWVTADIWPDPDAVGYVIYTGQAKTRDEHRAAEEHSIPVLADATKACGALARLRTLRNFDHYRSTIADAHGILPCARFNAETAKSLGRVTRRAFNRFFAQDQREITPKELRKLYAVMAYKFCRPPGMTLSRFLIQMLGHNGYASLHHYEDYMPYLLAANTR